MKLGKGYCNGQKKSNSKYAVDRYGVNLEKEVSADTFYKRFLLESDCLNEKEKDDFHKISADMENYLAAGSLNALSSYLLRYYGKKVIILLDEYDTPMQEAYVHGYWDETVEFMRNLFNATFQDESIP